MFPTSNVQLTERNGVSFQKLLLSSQHLILSQVFVGCQEYQKLFSWLELIKHDLQHIISQNTEVKISTLEATLNCRYRFCELRLRAF